MPVSRACMKKNCLNSFHVMPIDKFLPHKMDRWPPAQMNTAHFIDPHDTHMDKKQAKINAISTLSNLIAELSLRTKWHTTCCM